MPFCLSPLPFVVRSVDPEAVVGYQIRSHTCFHKLEIPLLDKKQLERVILATIQSDNGCYGFNEE